MSSTQLSWDWIGGFFDGEGCISVRRVNYKKGMKAMTVSLQIHQKNIDILDQITEFIYGEIGAAPYLGVTNGCHYLQYSRQADVVALLEKLVPVLHVKKEFAIEAHSYMSEIIELREKYGLHWRKHMKTPVVPTRARLRAVGGKM